MIRVLAIRVLLGLGYEVAETESVERYRDKRAQSSNPVMLEVECKELTTDEQLALASSISDSLSGRALALVSDSKIVFDTLSGPALEHSAVEALLRDFVSRRKDAELYSTEWNGEVIVIHSPDPLARSRSRKEGRLPNNLLMCPFCPFVTPYQETYDIHVRSHGFAFPG